MPQAPAELLVITRTYDLMIWTCQHTTHFTRAYRFTLGDRLQRQVHGVLELLLRAKFSRQRVELLRTANLELELLRFAFRLAKDLRCLSLDSHRFVLKCDVRKLTQRGKR